MATTCIWTVKGSLENPLNYVRDAQKVTAPPPDYTPGEQDGLEHIMDFLGQADALKELETVLGYAVRPGKTGGKQFVTGVGCMEATARQEMQAVKERFGKTGGVVCEHGYQAFRPGEVTPELAHTIGVELARQLWGGRYQAVVATHLDRGHLHNHFVVNSVSYVDGRKLRGDFRSYDRMRILSDRLCREYGLSVIDRPRRGRTPSDHAYEEAGVVPPERTDTAHRIKADVEEAVRNSRSMSDFYRFLRQRGYLFRQGERKYFSLKAPWAERYTRLERALGPEWSREEIRRRIAESADLPPEEPARGPDAPPAQESPAERGAPPRQGRDRPAAGGGRIRFAGSWPIRKDPLTRFQRMCLRYCYVFGVFPRQQRRQERPDRQSLRRLRRFSAEMQYLAERRYTSVEAVEGREKELQETVEKLCALRRPLYRHPEERSRLEALNSELSRAREELTLCRGILRRQEEAERHNQKKEEQNDGCTGCCKRSGEPDGPDHAGGDEGRPGPER